MTSPSPFQAARVQTLGPALIGLLTVGGIAAPVAALLVTVYPFRGGEPGWRFETLSIFLTTAPHLAVAIAIVATFGLFGEMREALKAASLAAIVMGAMLLLLFPFYMLDFLQVRKFQPQTHIQSFNLAGLETAAVTVLLIPLLFWAGRKGLVVAKKHETPRATTAKQGLIVAQDVTDKSART